jgi:hypothetical protein
MNDLNKPLEFLHGVMKRFIRNAFLPSTCSGNFVTPLHDCDLKSPEHRLVSLPEVVNLASFLVDLLVSTNRLIGELKVEEARRVRANIALAAENEKLQSEIANLRLALREANGFIDTDGR